MINKKIFILVSIVVIIAYGIFTSPITINKELSAVKYRLGDEEFTENITIKIDGNYYRKIFSSDVYIGKIYIEGYEFTNESSGFSNLESTLTDIDFDNNGHGQYSYIKINSNGDIQRLMQGEIFINDKFSTLTMIIMENDSVDSSRSGWSSDNGLMISAPSKTREEALNISNSLMSEYMRGNPLE